MVRVVIISLFIALTKSQIGLGPEYGRLTVTESAKMYSSRNDEELIFFDSQLPQEAQK